MDSQYLRTAPAGDGGGQTTRPEPSGGSGHQNVQLSRSERRRVQLNELTNRVRGAKTSSHLNGSTTAWFQLKPSDPDFPYELEFLDCELRVPANYPDEAPTLMVKNRDIPREFCLNIERGFQELTAANKDSTLFSLARKLDKSLEKFLSEPKAEAVTVMPFKDTRHLEMPTASLGEPSKPVAPTNPQPSTPAPAPAPKIYVPEVLYTKEQMANAKNRRVRELVALESRLCREAFYEKSADGIVYGLPFTPKHRDKLAHGLQYANNMQLIVPLLYPLQDPWILLDGVDAAIAEPLEQAFAAKAQDQSWMPLLTRINYLVEYAHIMAQPVKPVEAEQRKETAMPTLRAGVESTTSSEKKPSYLNDIPRPPEWNDAQGSEEPDSSDSDDGDYTSDSEDGGALLKARGSHVGSGNGVERGTAISFPNIELHGVAILEINNLNISVKCLRCRTLNDIIGLKHEVEKSISCRRCGMATTAQFRKDFIHETSSRGGFIDISSGTVVDMLPSTFMPTCARCSLPGQSLESVRGEKITNVCRDCHSKFTFSMPHIKFLTITPGNDTAESSSGPKRIREKLNLQVGETLPKRGACQHYNRSYRWFRFSCCNRVYPCDKCHDTKEDHIEDWAKRMICGWCSREQPYAADACKYCGRSVIGKRGKGFWEGGKGTRDPTRMSRKDKRKYRRVGGSAKKD